MPHSTVRKIIVGVSGVTASLWLAFAGWLVVTAHAAGFTQPTWNTVVTADSGQVVAGADSTGLYANPTEYVSTVTFTLRNIGTGTCTATAHRANAYTGSHNYSDTRAISIAAGATSDVTYTWTGSTVELDDVTSWVPYPASGEQIGGTGCSIRYLASSTDVLGTDEDTTIELQSPKDYRIAVNDTFDDPAIAPDTTILSPVDGAYASAAMFSYSLVSSLGQWQVTGPYVGVFSIEYEVSDGSGGWDAYGTTSASWTGQYINGFVGVTGSVPNLFPPNVYRMRAKTRFVGYTEGAWSAWTEFTTQTAFGGGGGASFGGELGMPSCSIIGAPQFGWDGADWTFAPGDGAECVYSWVKFLLWPPSPEAFYSLVMGSTEDPEGGVVDVLLTTWPLYYVTDFVEASTDVAATACPLPTFGGGTGPFGASVPEFDVCAALADVDDVIEGSGFEPIAVALVWFGVVMYVLRAIPRVVPFVNLGR